LTTLLSVLVCRERNKAVSWRTTNGEHAVAVAVGAEDANASTATRDDWWDNISSVWRRFASM